MVGTIRADIANDVFVVGELFDVGNEHARDSMTACIYNANVIFFEYPKF